MNTRAMFQSKVASKFGPYADEIMGHYDTLVARLGENQALDVMLEVCSKFRAQLQQAKASTSLPLSPTGKEIRSALEVANKQKVESNSLIRIRELITRLRANIGKCSATVDGVEISKDEIPLPELPECLRGGVTTYTANGSMKDKRVSLAIEVRNN